MMSGRWTVLAIVILAGATTVSPTVDAGGQGTCRVRNVTRGAVGASFKAMVEAAGDGDQIRVRGTCEGGAFVNEDIVIVGVGDPRPVITGRRAHRILRVADGAVVALRHLDLARGRASGSGGAVVVRGTLTIDDSIVRDSVAEADGGGIHVAGGVLVVSRSVVRDNRALAFVNPQGGGGIHAVHGSVTLIDSVVQDNIAPDAGGGSGGGIYLEFSTLDMVGSVVRGNEVWNGDGGGIVSWWGAINLVDSEVRHNESSGYGGGIQSWKTPVTLLWSEVSGNRANVGGGVDVGDGVLSITDSRIHHNVAEIVGGGILSADGVLTLTRTVVDHNHAERGGGVASSWTAMLRHSVIRDNTAVDDGGGILNFPRSTLELVASTVMSNEAGRGGGILNQSRLPDAVILRRGSAVTGNTPDDCRGTDAC